MSKAPEYQVDEEDMKPERTEPQEGMHGWIFVYSALVSFVIGLIGMGIGIYNDKNLTLILFGFSLSFFLAPALSIYPLIRILVGEGKPLLAAILSALFGWYVQSSIKKKMDE